MFLADINVDFNSLCKQWIQPAVWQTKLLNSERNMISCMVSSWHIRNNLTSSGMRKR